MKTPYRVLVTGGRGFVGAPTVDFLVERGHRVHGVSRDSGNGQGSCNGRGSDNGQGQVSWHVADLLDPVQVERLVVAVRPTHLLHLAWYTKHQGYWSALENLRWLEASLQLVREFAASGGRRVVIAGSCAEYHTEGGVCVESATPLVPLTLYGASKHALQVAVSSFAATAGVSAAWARVFYLYGPREQPRRLVPSVVQCLLRHEPVACSAGSQLRDYLYVDDAAAALVSLLESPVEGAVNIASGVPITVRDLVQRIGHHIGCSDLVQLGALPRRIGEPDVLVANVDRLTREVGWRPQVGIDAGLTRTIEWWGAARPSLATAGEP